MANEPKSHPFTGHAGSSGLETSVPGVFAARDLTARTRAAIAAAASGMQAAAMMNYELTVEFVSKGAP